MSIGEQGGRDPRRRRKGMSATAKATRFVAKDALLALRGARNERDVVITTMSPARDWMTLGPQSPLDIVFVPSAMGHATSLGLGLGLAQPDRRVIVCNGDGSMLMNLGSLVTIVGAGATNLVVLVFQNGVYEVTGAQPMPAEADFATIARGAGFSSVFEFSNNDEWAANVHAVLGAPGPVFAVLRVEPDVGIPGPKSPGPAGERARRLREALQH
jgi:sulfopyruvate decarboxylase subunit beta